MTMLFYGENVKGKWAQVENQLKRRYDLMPNLVETVKGIPNTRILRISPK
jgi:LemA protein